MIILFNNLQKKEIIITRIFLRENVILRVNIIFVIIQPFIKNVYGFSLNFVFNSKKKCKTVNKICQEFANKSIQ